MVKIWKLDLKGGGQGSEFQVEAIVINKGKDGRNIEVAKMSSK